VFTIVDVNLINDGFYDIKAGMYRLAKKNYKKVLQHIGTSTSFGKPTVNIPADDTPAQHDKDPGSLNFASRVSHNRPTDQGDSELRSQLQLAAHLNLALCYLKLGNNLKALDSSDRALEIEPTSDKGLYRRGQVSLESSLSLDVYHTNYFVLFYLY